MSAHDAMFEASVHQQLQAEWHDLIAPYLELGPSFGAHLHDPSDRLLRHELYRGILGQFASGFLSLLAPHPDYPDLVPFTTTGMTIYLDNPDANYYLAPLRDDGVYRVSGFRGSVHKFDLQIGAGAFLPRGDVDEQGSPLAAYDFDSDVTLGESGEFDVILSRRRPEGHDGDWWELAEGTTYALVRQTSYDWLGEIPGRICLDRLDIPAARPRPSADDLAGDLSQVFRWTAGTMTQALRLVEFIETNSQENELVNVQLTLETNGLIAKPNQWYGWGAFNLGDDEALVIEFDVPTDVNYWSIHLGDALTFTLDWSNRQTSLNGFSAHVAPDGVARCVVSAGDPGVANWLDTMGHERGTICVRWDGSSAPSQAYAVTRMPLAEVADFLAPHASACTPRERDESIRRRRRGAQLRKRW